MRVLVIGGDIHGYIATHVFRWAGFKTMMITQEDSSRELIEDLMYIRNTPLTSALMKELDVLFSTYIVRGGIMLHEEVRPFPRQLKDLDKDYVQRIRYDYYRKTRKVATDDVVKALARPISSKTKTAIRPDMFGLYQKMISPIKVIKRKIKTITEKYIEVSGGKLISFDKLVIACPLWEIVDAAAWPIPRVEAMRSHVAKVTAKEDVYEKYDFFYTPYTPANYIHFVWSDGEHFFAEVSGEFDKISLESDLNFLFKRGWYPERIYKNLRGYTLPFEAEIVWPENVHPVSPYSLWDDQLGFDDTLSATKGLVKKWRSI